MLNHSLYEGSQQSMISQMSRFQNSEISNVTIVMQNNPISQQFIDNFKKFFIEFVSKPDFFNKIEDLYKIYTTPRTELKLALQSFVKSVKYVKFKENIQNTNIESNLSKLDILSKDYVNQEKIKTQIDEVNKILFGSKLDKIVRILTSKDIIGTQQEVHFAVGRIYFSAHSRARSNYNRNAFKQLKYSGRDMIYNIIRHYVVNQQPGRQKTHICSDQDTQKYPIPAFILNYLQILFMPVYNQFQELFDTHVMSNYQKDQDQFYQSIFSPITQYIIPFFQNLPTEFCNFFSQFYQIINENHNQFSDNYNDQYPVKTLFLQRFFLNIHLREVSLPMAIEKQKDYVEALNLFSSLFYNSDKNQNPIFQKLKQIVQDCFLKLVSSYHTQSGHMDVYNLYLVDPIIKQDYNYIHKLIKRINFSEHEQKDYSIQKFKQGFSTKKRIEQKQQMDIIREIATPINENISAKLNDNSPQRNQYQKEEIRPTQVNENQDLKIKNISQTPTNFQQSQQMEFPNQIPKQQFNQGNSMNLYNKSGTTYFDGPPKTGEYQGMYFQGNYYMNPDEDSEEFLKHQLDLIKIKKQKLDEEQMIIERHKMKMDTLNNQKVGQAQSIASYFQSYQNGLSLRNQEEKIKLEYEKKLTDQFEQIINNQKNNIELNDHKAAMTDEIILLHERNEFLKMIMKSRYPTEVDYIDTLDNKENLQQWKQTFELQQKQQERREKRSKRNQEDDEFYYYQNIINKAFKKVEEADIKLEIHQKVNAEL